MPTVEEREERRKAKLEALRAEIQKGFDSGPMEEIDDQWIERIKARGRERLAARKLSDLRYAPSRPYPPTTRSSRWIISARPLMPRMVVTSGEERPLIRSASSAS